MECAAQVILVLDPQVNDLSDRSGSLGVPFDVVDWDHSGQLWVCMSSTYELQCQWTSQCSQVDKIFNKHGVLLSMVLRHRGTLVPSSEKGGSYEDGVFGRLYWGCLGTTCSVLRSMVTEMVALTYSLVDAYCTCSKSKNLLSWWAMHSHLTSLKTLLVLLPSSWPLMHPSLPLLLWPLKLLRSTYVNLINWDCCFWRLSAVSWDWPSHCSEQLQVSGLCLSMSIGMGGICTWVVAGVLSGGNSAQLRQLTVSVWHYLFGGSPGFHMTAFPTVHARWERCLRVDLQKEDWGSPPDVGIL